MLAGTAAMVRKPPYRNGYVLPVADATVLTTDIPFRLDRLPWARWHWAVVVGLGITWILDGLEVTIVGTIAPVLTTRAGLGLTPTEIGLAATTYLVGACAGALVFGALTDRFWRKRLFLVTLTWYLIATALTAFSWNFASFAAFRLLAGAGIGGEYSAVNSAIDELIPARRRGVADIAINGTWWIGTLLGALLSLPRRSRSASNARRTIRSCRRTAPSRSTRPVAMAWPRPSARWSAPIRAARYSSSR